MAEFLMNATIPADSLPNQSLMPRKFPRFLFHLMALGGLFLSACGPSNTEATCQSQAELYSFRFDSNSELKAFRAEVEGYPDAVRVIDGRLDIDAPRGATLWFARKLTAPLEIAYTATVVDAGGPNDRVSDLNCFFMAIDPLCPSDVLACPDSLRTGRFPDYHRLRTYYVGYGGHDNTTTRMRRYPGYSGERPVLPGHDLGAPHLLQPNSPVRIRIRVEDSTVRYWHDDALIFEMNDSLPYHEGWFAFRTVRNHMQVDDLVITSL